MSGDDLAIFLFFMTCAVAFGVEAFKAETTFRRLSFAAIAIGCLLIGISWAHIKTLWPALTDKIATVATDPVSWFVIIMFLLAVVAFHPPKSRPNTGKQEEERISPRPVPRAAPPPVPPPPPPVPVALLAEVSAKPEMPAPKKREFIDVSVETLVGLCNQENLTRVQTDRLVKPYIGKWMRVTGIVTDIFPSAVALRTKEAKPPPGMLLFDVILIVADDAWKERFHMLERNRKITVIGMIQEVDRSMVTLYHPELAS
jgi:hypothetical protein